MGADMETLPEAQKRILTMFRTRRELLSWRAVSEYASVAWGGVDELRDAASRRGAADFIPTAQKALAAIVRLLQRADDSNGEIGTVARELLALHAELCNMAPPATAKLVDWLIDFNFDRANFFEADVAAYRDALKEHGLDRFADKLAERDAALGATPSLPITARWAIDRNYERLAVARQDASGVVASFGELTRSYRIHALAKALIEVGAIDAAIEFAERATLHETGWQAEAAGRYWCDLLHEHRARDEELAGRQMVFERWPTAQNAVPLATLAGTAWEERAADAYERLEGQHPSELIKTLIALGLNDRAWHEAHRHPTSAALWTELIGIREKSDPASVIPILLELVDSDLKIADARNYKQAVRRLKQLRSALKACGRGDEFAPIVAAVREENQRRPRLLEMLLRAGF